MTDHPEGIDLRNHPEVQRAVMGAVDQWLRWVAQWKPGTQRTRAAVCRKCSGSLLLQAAGLPADAPHQVAHALMSRLQRIIDRTVDDYTAEYLPALQAELDGSSLWTARGFDPREGLDPEYEGIELDPEPESDAQPFLFTLDGLAEETQPEPALPRPPLSDAEKQQIRREIETVDQVAAQTGRLVCFALTAHRGRIERAVEVFVEPQIQALLAELSQHLEPPT